MKVWSNKERISLLTILLAAIMAIALTAAPGSAQSAGIESDAPPEEPTGENPLGEPRTEDASAPIAQEDAQPSSGAAMEDTVRTEGGYRVVSDELIVSYEDEIEKAEKADIREEVGAESEALWPEVNAEAIEFEDDLTADELAAKKAELAADPAIESVDYNSVLNLAWYPNDTEFRAGRQSNIKAVDALRAWNFSRGGTRVAVLDSGCYTGHVELNEGKVVAQKDFWYGDAYADDQHGHGTHVSSILAADTNNKLGIAGGAPAAKILCGKITSNAGNTNVRVMIEGLRWALANGAEVVNLSIAGGTHNQALEDHMQRMYNSGVFVAAAAGNDNAYKEAEYPAAYPGVMAVAGTTRDGTERYLTTYGGSNRGPYVDIAAPGENILGAYVDGKNDYHLMSGTSMATPHVSAAAALLAAKGKSVSAIHRQLKATADDRGAPGRDNTYGHGLVDFHGSFVE